MDTQVNCSAAGNSQGPLLLTTAQAAELCGISERTLWSWSRSGIAPQPIHIGHGLRPMVRFRTCDLLEWIRNGCPRVDGKGGGK